jgi:hypothetical protein
MDKFGIELALETLREAKMTWQQAFRDFSQAYEKAVLRLIHEAMINNLSVEQFALWSGLTPKRVRFIMRRNGLDPKRGSRFLANAAAIALQRNAELMGIEPNQIDLMSPLAYLPGGDQLRRAHESEAVKGVKDVDVELDEDLLMACVKVFQFEWHKSDEVGHVNHRTEEAMRAVFEFMAEDHEA